MKQIFRSNVNWTEYHLQLSEQISRDICEKYPVSFASLFD